MSIFLSLDTWCENCKWKSFADHERFVQIKYGRGDNFDYKITTATVFGTIMKLIVAHIIYHVRNDDALYLGWNEPKLRPVCARASWTSYPEPE